MSLFGAAACVDYNDASGFPGGNRQICVSHTAEEGAALLLEAVFIFSPTGRVTSPITAAGSFDTARRVTWPGQPIE